MSHTKEISRANKCLLLFLLDQSGSMEDRLGSSSQRKMDELATAINSLLENIVIRATGTEGIRDYMDIGVLGYSTDSNANPILESPLSESLRARQDAHSLVTIAAIAEHARIEQRMQEVCEEDTGEIIETTVDFPVWVEPKAQLGTPMCYALTRAIEILDGWIADHQESFPPIVINITDGETSDGADPLVYANSLKERSTADGNVLLFNCHLSETQADPFMFPHNGEILPDKFARILFDMSSEFPDSLYHRAVAEGFDLKPGARGMAFNADMVSLIKFLDIGTRVSLR